MPTSRSKASLLGVSLATSMVAGVGAGAGERSDLDLPEQSCWCRGAKRIVDRASGKQYKGLDVLDAGCSGEAMIAEQGVQS